MDGFWQDLRFGWRSLRARAGFTLVAVSTLALGVAATTTIFSAVNALQLRPLPVEDADRVVFGMALREGFDPFATSFLEYALYRDQAASFVSSGLGTPRLFNLVGAGEPERLRGAAVMASYLRTLAVKPILGRLFTDEEDRPGGPPVVLLGHDLWQRRFAGERDVIGRVLRLEGGSYAIVGVLPRGFDMPYSAEVWVPMQVGLEALPLSQRAATANEFVARLKPGVRLEQADAELKALAGRLATEYPQIRRGWSYGIVPLRRQLLADLDGRTQRSLATVGVAVGFLLLICCANVAGLLLARGVTREGEIAVRVSLGAGRARLVRQLLVESALLAALGGALGVCIAVWTQPVLRALNPIRAVGLASYLDDFRIDTRVLLFSLAVTLLTGVVSGLLPALSAARAAGPMAVLKRESTRAEAGGRRSLRALVVGEIAVAATLLVGAGLVTGSFDRLQRVELGFRPDGVLTMELPLSPAKYVGPARQSLFMAQVLDRVRAQPGVTSAGMTTNVPLQRGVTLDSVFEVEGRPRANPADVPATAHRLVSPGYLETLGVTLVRGRLLDERDRADAPPVAVVSEELVRQSWPGEEPIGKRLRRLRAGEPGPWMSVVGVVRDVKEDSFNFRIDRPVWYLPYAQQAFPPPVSLPLNLLVRTGGDPASVAAAVREAVHAVDPEQPIAGVMPMMEYLPDVLIAARFSAVLLCTLAAIGLSLAALGLYGLMAYSVGQRRREIGLRMALGARPRDVVRLVVGEGAVLAAAGLAFGVAGAGALTRLLSSALYQVSATDPATFAAAAAILIGVALVAAWLPARAASRISPLAALRHD
jgi:putative ABC transport system permease protein